MTGVIPSLDLRLSEYAPDRELATQQWAVHQLAEQHQRASDRQRLMDEAYRELARKSQERELALRLEAIKRGEVYIPPRLEFPGVARAASMPRSASGAYGLAQFHHSPTAPVDLPGYVVLPPGYKLEHF